MDSLSRGRTGPRGDDQAVEGKRRPSRGQIGRRVERPSRGRPSRGWKGRLGDEKAVEETDKSSRGRSLMDGKAVEGMGRPSKGLSPTVLEVARPFVELMLSPCL